MAVVRSPILTEGNFFTDFSSYPLYNANIANFM